MRTGRSSLTTVAASELAREVVGPVAEVDGEAADDEGGPDDDRVADPVGDRDGLLERGRDAAGRLRDAEPLDHRREAGALLGPVDGLDADAGQGHARRVEVARPG